MIENAVGVLNELLTADPEATNEFFRLSVTVNKDVCDHPTIQVRSIGNTDSEGTLRPLGLLNGVIQDGNRVIVMHTDDSGTTIIRFSAGTLEDGKVTVDDK